MNELITNFNEISFKEMINEIPFMAILIISLIPAIIFIFEMYIDCTLKELIIGCLKCFSITFVMLFALCFCSADKPIRLNRLEVIIETANENDLSSKLRITDNEIIFNDIACKHNIDDIKKYIVKTDKGKYIFVNN